MPYHPIKEVILRINKKNQNWLCALTGQTGSGKSYSAIALARIIDPNFHIRNVVFTPEDFIARLNDRNEETRLRRGNALVWDEAGVGIPARDWYSISNKALGLIFQTFRHENLAVIFTMPTLDMVDIQARKLFHTHITTFSINRKEKYTILKWLNLTYNQFKGQIYNKYPIMTMKGRTTQVRLVNVRIAPKEILKAYEKKKTEFTSELKKEVEMTLRNVKLKQKPKQTKTEKEIIQEMLSDFKEHGNNPTISYVCAKYSIGDSRARRLRAKLILEKKKEVKE